MLRDLLSTYVQDHPQLRPLSLAAYGYACDSLERWARRHWLTPLARNGPGWSERSFDWPDVSEAMLRHWLPARLAERAQKTVQRERGDLLVLWRYAHEKGLACPAATNLARVQVDKRPPESWDLPEINAILNAAGELVGPLAPERGLSARVSRSLFWRSVVLTLYDTSVRVRALLSVTHADYDPARRVIRFLATRSKTRLEQCLRVSGQTAGLLAQLQAASAGWRPPHWPAGEAPPLFPWPFSKRPLYAWFSKILQRAGLTQRRWDKFHRLRKTSLTWTAASAGPAGVALAQQQAGHTTPRQTVEVYLDPRFTQPLQAADVLPRLDGPPVELRRAEGQPPPVPEKAERPALKLFTG